MQGDTSVWSYDLAPITARFSKHGHAAPERVEGEFRKFAALCVAHPEGGLSPSRLVDTYWHEFVLDTARYRDFCQHAYGAFMDHVPDDAGAGMAVQFEATKALYTQRFGPPDPTLWMEPGNSMTGRRSTLG